MILRASQRASELIREIAGGNPAKEIAAAGELPANPADVSLHYSKCDQVLGIAIKSKTVDEILELSVGNFGVIGFVRSKIQFGSCPDFGGRGSRALIGSRQGGHR